MNTLPNSKVHIPVCAGFLSFNASLLLLITTELISNILCNMQPGFEVHFE